MNHLISAATHLLLDCVLVSGRSQLAHHRVLSLFISVLASAQRPEEVIQRYMEVVAGVPDEVNV